MSRIDEVTFLRKLQRLLEEGDFVATYKFALLQALADLSVENDAAPDSTLSLLLDQVAEKFIEYYWRQAPPYRAIFRIPNKGRLNGFEQIRTVQARWRCTGRRRRASG